MAKRPQQAQKSKYKSYEFGISIDPKSIVDNPDGSFYVTGIANNKNKQDSYGDIPTNFEGKPVYILDRYLKNPIALIDHWYTVENIVGNFPEIKETDKGLEFKFRAMANPITDIAKHAKQAIKEGILRTVSIGGDWFFEDPENPNNLTKAVIYEISWVTIPADSDALADTNIPKGKDKPEDKKSYGLSELITDYKNDKKDSTAKKILERILKTDE